MVASNCKLQVVDGCTVLFLFLQRQLHRNSTVQR
jgi:hypothetical protein